MPRNDKLTPEEADLTPIEFSDGELWTITEIEGDEWPPEELELSRVLPSGSVEKRRFFLLEED